MANADRVYGLRLVGPVKKDAIKRFFIPATDATAVAAGDVVKLAGSADADGVATVAKASAGNNVVGVVVSVEYNPDALSTLYRPASTAQYVFVCVDPEAVYMVQEDAVGGALAATNVGQNADWIDAGVNTTTGMSGIELDSSTAATTNTLSLRILGFARRPDNAIGANADVLVQLNLHELRQATGV